MSEINQSRTMTYDGQEFYARSHVDVVDGLENATATSAGLMSASDKSKLDGLERIDASHLQPATTTQGGIMSAADKAKLDGLQKIDLSLLNVATESANGLMSKEDKKRLDSLKTNSNPYNSVSGNSVSHSTVTNQMINSNVNVWPNSSQKVNLHKKVSECRTGIVLVWRSDTTDDYYHYTHVPKLHAQSHNKAKISDTIPVNATTTAIKSVLVTDSYVTGVNENASNEARKIRLHEILEY